MSDLIIIDSAENERYRLVLASDDHQFLVFVHEGDAEKVRKPFDGLTAALREFRTFLMALGISREPT